MINSVYFCSSYSRNKGGHFLNTVYKGTTDIANC